MIKCVIRLQLRWKDYLMTFLVMFLENVLIYMLHVAEYTQYICSLWVIQHSTLNMHFICIEKILKDDKKVKKCCVSVWFWSNPKLWIAKYVVCIHYFKVDWSNPDIKSHYPRVTRPLRQPNRALSTARVIHSVLSLTSYVTAAVPWSQQLC